MRGPTLVSAAESDVRGQKTPHHPIIRIGEGKIQHRPPLLIQLSDVGSTSFAFPVLTFSLSLSFFRFEIQN